MLQTEEINGLRSALRDLSGEEYEREFWNKVKPQAMLKPFSYIGFINYEYTVEIKQKLKQ